MKDHKMQRNMDRQPFKSPWQAKRDQKVHPADLIENSALRAKSDDCLCPHCLTVKDYENFKARKEVQTKAWLKQAAQENLTEGSDVV